MRVIAGALGGRRLVAPRGHATRPTSDRVREALFSALGDVRGSAVLDLYAGTGALGIEALSRGALRAVFVENARSALAALRANVDSTGLSDVSRVIGLPVARAIRAIVDAGPFDLALLDPPYAALADVPAVIAALVAGGALGPEATVVVEHAARDAPPDLPGLERASTRVYGDTAITCWTAVRGS